MKKKIIIAISGGVDSSISALLLKQQGYEVEAIFMKNWIDAECSSENDINDIKLVCEKIKIKLHIVEFSNEYWNKVFSKSIYLFNKGDTPNPDILCNKEIKFKILFEYICHIGIYKIATGHYIQKVKINKVYFLLNSFDKKKDQSYFLCMINERILRKSLFPIGHMKKSFIRKISTFYNFCNAKKKDSTGICFIGKRNFQNFLNRYIIAKSAKLSFLRKKIDFPS